MPMSGVTERIAVIIEDDSDVRNLLETVLVQGGFKTHAVSTGLDGVEAVRRLQPILTTLDISLPGIDGFEVARRIRTFSRTYIIMVSARLEEIDTLMGLDAGADDYLTKPFRPRELRARIEAMLRRLEVGTPAETEPLSAPVDLGPAPLVPQLEQPFGPLGLPASLAPVLGASAEQIQRLASQASPAVEETWLQHDPIRINAEMRICEVDGVPLSLTRTEFDLLFAIMLRHHRVISKHELALEIRGATAGDYVSESDQRAVEVHMANLRRKLQDDASDPRYIETVRGVGYRLALHPRNPTDPQPASVD